MKRYLVMIVILGFIGNVVANDGIVATTKNNNQTASVLAQLGE